MPDHGNCNHRRRSLRALVSLAGLGSVMLVPGCGNNDGETASASYLFVQTSPVGTLTASPGGGDFTLTLEDVPAHMVYFQDRPDRDYGNIPLDGFVASWEGVGFASDPPNAVLTVADSRQDLLVVELFSPEYDGLENTLSYIVRDPEGESENLIGFPADFVDASLFIDDAGEFNPLYDLGYGALHESGFGQECVQAHPGIQEGWCDDAPTPPQWVLLSYGMCVEFGKGFDFSTLACSA